MNDKPVYTVLTQEDYEHASVVYATTSYDEAMAEFQGHIDLGWHDRVLVVQWVGGEATTLESECGR